MEWGRVIKKEDCTETEKGETLGFKDAVPPILVPSIFSSKFTSIINDKEDELISDLGKMASRKGRRQACR